MNKVLVVGNSGSGKTHLARRLVAARGAAHLELDALHHGPGWRAASAEQLRADVAAFLDAHPDGWVVDGNYRGKLGDLVLDRADTVVWLDYPRRVVFARVLRRTLGRVVARRELWNGNRERWRMLLNRDAGENILLWSWTQHHSYHRTYLELSAGRPDLAWVRLASPREARRWLDVIG